MALPPALESCGIMLTTHLAGMGIEGHYMGTRARMYGNIVGPKYIDVPDIHPAISYN